MKKGILLVVLIAALACFLNYEPKGSSHSSTSTASSSYSSGSTSKTSTSKTSTTFTNKYGTATTYCNHSGCTNYIASSGDTNCCITHSNRCLNCNVYIDEDAMYCMSCLSGSAANHSKSSYSSPSSSYNSKSYGGCKYKYSDGSVCGSAVGSNGSFCDYHFESLNSTFNSLMGNG